MTNNARLHRHSFLPAVSTRLLGWPGLPLVAFIASLQFARGQEIRPLEAERSEQVVYSEDYAKVWSEEKVTTAPGDGSKLHGPFQAQPVTLSLSRLPVHAWVKLRFKLSIIGSWDGSSSVWGPDLWSLQVRGGERLIFATFGNMGDFANNNVQSFPDDYPWGRHTAGAGALGKNVLGFPKDGGVSTRDELNDAVYPIEVVFSHSGESLILDFAGIYDDYAPDLQSWGVGNVEIVAMNAPPVLEDSAFPGLWEQLASRDAMQANAALWKMVAAGERALDFIEGRISGIQPVTGAEGLRLHRAHRVCRLISGKRGHSLNRKIDPLIPEHLQDIRSLSEGGAR